MGYAQAGEPPGGEGEAGAHTTALDAPTRRISRPPRSSRPTTRSGSLGSPSTSVQATTDALVSEEIGRIRILARVLMLIVGAGMLMIPFLNGDPTARSALVFGHVVSLMALVQLHRLASSPERYNVVTAGVLALPLALTLCAATNFFGVFSPMPMIGSLGLYMVSLGSSTRWSALVFAVIAGGHALLVLPILAGLRDDPGMVTAESLGHTERVVMAAGVLGIYSLAFGAGRAARRVLVHTVKQLERAVREITERDAQLNEAKRELERAAWLGGEGRFSHQQVGSYRLGNVIGRGGMGEVYEGEHTETGGEAAVKLLGRTGFADPNALARFAREARAAASLQSPHVVRVLEVSGEDAPVPYLAMERLRGEDLSSLLRREKRLSRRDTLRMVQQVGSALDAARRAGIVHRDLKPQNIFLARATEGASVWKVLDFGVSKLLGQNSLTHEELVGTPEYMAPEQARGADLDHRADLYALAAVTYRCLTGRPPYSGKDLANVVYRVVHEKPLAPTEVAKLHRHVEAVLAIGLARDPSHRFESGKELARALEDALAGELGPRLVERAVQRTQEEPWSRAAGSCAGLRDEQS